MKPAIDSLIKERVASGQYSKEDEEDEYEIIGKCFDDLTKHISDDYIAYLLPCCWPSETPYNAFVGRIVAPFPWYHPERWVIVTSDRPGHIDLVSKSYIERPCGRKYEVLRPYTRSDVIATISDYINEICYIRHKSWTDTLFLRNYPVISNWSTLLDKLYHTADSIEKITSYARALDPTCTAVPD